MNRRFSKALALLMAVSLCATPAFAGSITYNGNTGTGSSTHDSDYGDSGVTIKTADGADFTLTDHTFSGWNTQADGSGTAYKANADIIIGASDNITLYAQWTRNEAATQKVTITLTGADAGFDFSKVTVTLTKDGKNTKLTGDNTGKFTGNLEAGQYTVKVEGLTGYTAAATTVTVENKAVTQEIKLTKEAVKVECVVTITVEDKATQKGVTGATVTVTDKDNKGVTVTEGTNGAYTFTATAAGTYKITVKATGYKDGEGSVQVAESDKTATASISLTAIPKAEVTVDPAVENKFTEDLGTTSEIYVEGLGKNQKVEIAPAKKSDAEVSQEVSSLETLITPDEDGNIDEDAIKEKFKGYDDIGGIKEIKTKTAVAISISITGKDSHDGQVNVTIPVPTALKNAENILAIHQHGNIKKLIKTRIKEINKIRKVLFELDGLSDIVLVEYTPGTGDGGDPGEDGPKPPVDNKPSDDRYVAYNPGGSSGGSGGGGGGGSSSKRGATSMFNSLTNTINGILKAQLSKGTVGATSAVTGSTTATAPVSTPATQAAATRAVSQAISKARANGSNSAEAIMQNVSVVSASILESMAADARKSGVNAYLSVDTMKNGIVDVRVRIPVSAAARLGRDVNMASVDNTAVKARFNRYYSNRLDVVALAQNGSFGVPASVAARLALGNANAADLHFYSFNAAANSYQEIIQTGAFIDVNGYLHFNTELGGYIIVSDGALARK